MVKLNEIYVLNRALDGAEIYALPKLDVPLSDFLISSVKDGLIGKKILSTHKSFTDEGVLLTQRINLYKTATKYISLNQTTIGFLDKNKGIALTYNPYFDTYAFNMVSTEDIVSSLTEVYAFLQEDGEVVDEHEESIAFDVLKERYPIERKKSLVLKTKSEELETHEEVFLANNQFYLYNHKEETLARKNKENLLDTIQERVKAHESNISST